MIFLIKTNLLQSLSNNHIIDKFLTLSLNNDFRLIKCMLQKMTSKTNSQQ